MAKSLYVGVSDKARKVKKMYFGVDGKARKVKKAYIGIGGVARPFFSSGELAYYGTVTGLSGNIYGHHATGVGGYALFAGGYREGILTNLVTAYDASLTRTEPTPLSESKAEMAASSVGDYALFPAGLADYGSPSATMDVYNTSLTRSQKAFYDTRCHQIGRAHV